MARGKEEEKNLPDFIGIFHERLERIQELGQVEGEWTAANFHQPDIRTVKRMAIAGIFSLDGHGSFHVWLEDLHDKEVASAEHSFALHHELSQRLSRFLWKNGIWGYPNVISAFVAQDQSDNIHLILPQDSVIIELVNLYGEEYEQPSRTALYDTIEFYGFDSVITESDHYEAFFPGSTIASKLIFDKRFFEVMQECRAFTALAEEHSLSNSQMLRLRIAANSMYHAGMPTNWHDLATEIKAQEE